MIDTSRADPCPVCGLWRPQHEPGCAMGRLVSLALDMWHHIYELEEFPTGPERCGGYEGRLLPFLSYPGSSHFPGMSSSSSASVSDLSVTPSAADTVADSLADHAERLLHLEQAIWGKGDATCPSLAEVAQRVQALERAGSSGVARCPRCGGLPSWWNPEQRQHCPACGWLEPAR